VFSEVPSTVTYAKWYLNGQSLKTRVLFGNAPGTDILTIPRVTKDHAGIYECRIHYFVGYKKTYITSSLSRLIVIGK